jgi:hypothetical protein
VNRPGFTGGWITWGSGVAARASVPLGLASKVPSEGLSVPEEGLETHGRTLCGLGVRPRGRRELRRIKVAPRVQRARNPAGPCSLYPLRDYS